MKRNNIFEQIVLYIALLSCMACSGLNSKNSDNIEKMDTAFIWRPFVASPKFYPMEVMYANVRLGNTDDWVGTMERFTGAGLGEYNGVVDTSSESGDGKLPVPSAIDVLWLSHTEKKFYRLKAELPHYLQQRMLEMFRTPYYDWSDKKYWSYEGFVINMLPKGKVWLYLAGMGRRELICDSLVGKEVEVALKDFDKEGYEYYKTFDAFCKARLNDDLKVVENLKQNGIPDTLWEKYKQRYHYKIEFDFEDKNTVIEHDYLYRYLTGEFYREDKKETHFFMAAVREIGITWLVGTTKYNGFFYFDENEIIETYAKAFNPLNKHGKLIVRVSKYNNKFDIYLLIDGKQFPLTKTMIHVFRETPEHKKDEEVPFYNNHEDIYSGDIRYIGG